MQHFLDINDFSREQLLAILARAQAFIQQDLVRDEALLTGKTVANLFFEPSTRTHASFDLAAQKLNAHVLNLDIQNSSTKKGESLLDTVLTLQAMGVNIFVLRHSESVMRSVAEILNPGVRLINAGEGCGGHPTQALLDVLTIQQHHKNFDNLAIAIIGDVLHSRVARSTIAALKMLGCQDIRLIGPKNLLPTDIEGVRHEVDLATGINNVDVIMMLRLQHERMRVMFVDDPQNYVAEYQLNKKTLALAKPGAIVMHPGPINRGVELTDEIADSEQSVILRQVKNGVAVRMAVLTMPQG